MAIINAHVFPDLAAANAAIDIINEGEGIPVSPESVTRTYVTPYPYFNGEYYIYADAVTISYLGPSVEIEPPYDDV